MPEHQQERIHQALRAALAAPMPGLSPDFDRKLEKRLRPQGLSARARVVFALYVFAALVATTWALGRVSPFCLLVEFVVLVPASFAWVFHRAETRPLPEPRQN